LQGEDNIVGGIGGAVIPEDAVTQIDG